MTVMLRTPLTSPLTGESFHRLATALAGVEAQTAMLRVHGEDGVGGVFVDEGRIAWAVAPGTSRFLADRLVSAGVDRQIIRELVDEGRRTGVPLGQIVVSRGLMSAGAFAELLFEHTVFSLGLMTSQRLGAIERLGGSFANAFTFPMVSLLAESVRRRTGAIAVVDALPETPLMAVEVSVVDGYPLPVRVLSDREPRLSELLQLATEAQGVVAMLGAGTASFRRRGRCWSVAGERRRSSSVKAVRRSASRGCWARTEGRAGHRRSRRSPQPEGSSTP